MKFFKEILSNKKMLALTVVTVCVVILTIAAIVLKDEIVPGWHIEDGRRYYVSFPFKRASGLTEIDGKEYIFENYGDHELLYGFNKYDGNRYFSGPDGAIVKGDYMVDGVVYGFDASTGILYLNEVRIFDGKLWYYDETGHRFFGIVEMDGRKYCFKEGGNLRTGLQVIDGKTYYFDPTNEDMQFGLRTVNGATYYFGEDGAAVTNKTIEIGGMTYKFGEDGKQIQ